jgi:predicted membrane protein (TIGR00267 family)
VSPKTAPGPTAWLRSRFATLRHYHRVAEVGEIARRYFAMNAFDGVLTTLGVLVGSYLGHAHSAHQVVAVGLAAAVAMGISGFYGSYLIERAERDRSLRELEDVTLSSLEDSDIAAASTYATIVIACVDGVSPFAAAALVLAPFLVGFTSLNSAYIAGVAIAFVELFALGMFLGRVSRQRLVWSGMKLAVAGVLCLVLSALLDWGLR